MKLPDWRLRAPRQLRRKFPPVLCRQRRRRLRSSRFGCVGECSAGMVARWRFRVHDDSIRRIVCNRHAARTQDLW
jgi:hypothetical protein